MKYEEERQARELHNTLADTFAASSPTTDVSVEGAGVHWSCSARRGDRICVIACFGHMGGYAVSFKTSATIEATGRTRLEKELVSAVSSWLQGNSLSELYEAFEYVDHSKRALQRFWDETIRAQPDLGQCATTEFDQEYGEFYHLRFITKERSCQIYFYGQNHSPDSVNHRNV